MDIESSTGDVSLIAGGVINISGQTLIRTWRVETLVTVRRG
jgi:hypothetical protein